MSEGIHTELLLLPIFPRLGGDIREADYSSFSREQLRRLASDGALSQYNVNGRDSNLSIIDALQKQWYDARYVTRSNGYKYVYVERREKTEPYVRHIKYK